MEAGCACHQKAMCTTSLFSWLDLLAQQAKVCDWLKGTNIPSFAAAYGGEMVNICAYVWATPSSGIAQLHPRHSFPLFVLKVALSLCYSSWRAQKYWILTKWNKSASHTHHVHSPWTLHTVFLHCHTCSGFHRGFLAFCPCNEEPEVT